MKEFYELSRMDLDEEVRWGFFSKPEKLIEEIIDYLDDQEIEGPKDFIEVNRLIIIRDIMKLKNYDQTKKELNLQLPEEKPYEKEELLFTIRKFYLD